MNTDNVLLVILLAIGIVVLSNLVMLALVRNSRNVNIGWLKKSGNVFLQPFKESDNEIEELRKRVEELKGVRKEE